MVHTYEYVSKKVLFEKRDSHYPLGNKTTEKNSVQEGCDIFLRIWGEEIFRELPNCLDQYKRLQCKVSAKQTKEESLQVWKWKPGSLC